MPNLELSFHVYTPGFSQKTMRRGELIGHRDKNGHNNPKFTPDHLKHAYEAIKAWMKEYNAMIDKPEPSKRTYTDDMADEVSEQLSTLKKVIAPANKDSAPDTLIEIGTWECHGECKCHD